MPLETEKLKFTLDLNKLDQSRIYTSKKGTRLLEFECVATPGGQYGQTHFITQRATKEERLAKVRLPILGNLALAFPSQAGTTHTGPSNLPPSRPLPPRSPASNKPPSGPDGSVDTSGVEPEEIPF